MALAVAEALEQGGALVVEAATGVGKTYAYLVPALLSGERLLLSTATKALQDQLFARDLPRLTQALGLGVRRALLKGRSSYLCLHRLELARHMLAEQGGSAAELRQLALVEQWAQQTRSGDLAELPGLDERSRVIPLVTSTRENCLGSDCPHFRQCHVNLARREAMAADVVVINHHLFFADLAIRESGMAELLPTARVVVFDEAHQLNSIGVQFLGVQLGTGQLLELSRDTLTAGLMYARGLAPWSDLAAALELATRRLRLLAGPQRAQPGNPTRLRWQGAAPDGVDAAAWQAGLARLAQAVHGLAEGLQPVAEMAPDLARLLERAVDTLERVQRFMADADPAWVRWVDVGGFLRLVESPLDIADTVRTRLLGMPVQPPAIASDDAPRPPDVAASGPAPADAGPPRSWVFVSATLGDDAHLGWFTEPCGLQQARILQVDSPFDYARQASLYVPPQLVRPGDAAHSQQLARLVGDAAARLGGRTLVLTTTLRALRQIGEALNLRFASGGPEVLMQGQAPKRVLMERFVQANAPGARGCVLVASSSFWEGVDLPGPVLQLVVIDKLPFPPPGDPLVEARGRRLQAQGRSPFADQALPEAAVALKQGAGRLIRSETDAGLLVIGDTRLSTMGYGRRLLAALPPMRRLTTQAAFEAELERLAQVARPTPEQLPFA